MNQHGFEFTPFGIVPIGTNLSGMASDEMAGATANVAPPTGEALVTSARAWADAAVVQKRAQVAQALPAAKPLKPADVLKLARARLKEIEREIARAKKLEPERDQLRRLLAAAAEKPRATVRSLPTRSA